MPDYRLATRRAARKFGVNEGVLLRLIRQESGFNPNARSSAGAQGIAQFMPGTAPSYGVNLHDNRVTDDLEGAAKYIRAGLDKYGSYTKALSVYNSGRPDGYKSIPETANYVRSILGGHEPSVQRSSSGGSTGSQQVNVSASVPQSAPSFDPGQAVSTLQGLLTQQAPPSVQIPQAPHGVVQAPVVNPQPSGDGIGALLAAAATPAQVLPEMPTAQAASVTVTGQAPKASAAASGGSGRYPTGRTGKIIGTPYAGTHTLGDWQSDRAVDIAVPKGTPMIALQDGVVVKVRHHPQDGGRFAGDQVTIRGANGNEYFYAHGIASVKPGQRIRKGQQLGVTGSANGVDHLHFGQQRGDVYMHLKNRR